jgi:hypothetical protein
MKPLLLGAAPLLEWFEAWIAQACCGSTTRTPSAPSTGCCRLMCPPTSSSMSLAIARAKPVPGTLSSSRLPRRSASSNASGITPGPSSSTQNSTALSRIRPLMLTRLFAHFSAFRADYPALPSEALHPLSPPSPDQSRSPIGSPCHWQDASSCAPIPARSVISAPACEKA